MSATVHVDFSVKKEEKKGGEFQKKETSKPFSD